MLKFEKDVMESIGGGEIIEDVKDVEEKVEKME
jgi:hypothetical protein